MANQPETATYDVGVLQWEVTTAVQGGVGGAANAPLLSLSNRTAYLKQHIDALEAGSYIPATVAPLASPALTGTPTAPTAASDTSTTQIATTAFVIGQASSTAPVMDGAATVGTSKKYARADHVHPIDTSRAPLASPALTGMPTAPTAAANTNTTQIASTAFVLGQASSTPPAMDGAAAVGTGTTFARADHVHPIDTSRAPLASPTFTGTVTIPGSVFTGNGILSSGAGFDAGVGEDGTISSGTYTPGFSGGNFRHVVNGGAFTFAAPTTGSQHTLIVLLVNSATAGAVTMSGFTKTVGDAFTTTNGDKFLVFITRIYGLTFASVAALQ